MAEAKYRGTYRVTRKAWTPVVNGGEALCHEPRCLEEEAGHGRHITPGTPWHLSHDPTGTIILGPSHARCNTSEAAIRGNKDRESRFLKL